MRQVGNGIGLRLGPTRVLGSLLFGCGADLERLGFGRRRLPSENLSRLRDQLGRSLLSLRDEVASCIVGGPEDLGRLDANCPCERRLVQDGVLRSALRLDNALAQNRLTLYRSS